MELTKRYIKIINTDQNVTGRNLQTNTGTRQCYFLVFSSTSTFTFFRAFGANLVVFRMRKVDVREKVDVQAPKSQLLYVNIDVPYVNKITLC